ncbi:MAG: disulfide bond formation protein B [Nitriliruptor sp.]|uniref:disulfide bond formation protein B n=1 Tax=Nitriliruptor sp. TaxID=2448056 RepID=UPI0034A02DF4
MQSAVERFAGALTIVAFVIAVATLVLLVRRRVPDWLRDEVALPSAWAIAAMTTAGSLWMSEVADYAPCLLCWYQRIAIYPLVVITGIAAWRRDGQVWRYVVPIAALGSMVSIWHLIIERNPSLGGACDPAAPCAVRWVEEFGFLTLPAMALTAAVAIALLTLAARPAAGPATHPTDPA